MAPYAANIHHYRPDQLQLTALGADAAAVVDSGLLRFAAYVYLMSIGGCDAWLRMQVKA